MINFLDGIATGFGGSFILCLIPHFGPLITFLGIIVFVINVIIGNPMSYFDSGIAFGLVITIVIYQKFPIEEKIHKQFKHDKNYDFLKEDEKSVITPVKKKPVYRPTYKLSVSPKEINTLRGMIPTMERDYSLEVGRRIWENYYKNAFDKMVLPLGKNTITGIYKIVCTKNNKIYIGQAKDIKRRWREHVRQGVGADFPSGNQMYADMLKFGPECFTFTIQEKCSESALNYKEKYWINYYNSYNNGYNKTSGNKG